jgi:hypothetical protein
MTHTTELSKMNSKLSFSGMIKATNSLTQVGHIYYTEKIPFSCQEISLNTTLAELLGNKIRPTEITMITEHGSC